jgi:hypothetical protein
MKLKLFLVLGLLYQTAYAAYVWNPKKPFHQWPIAHQQAYLAEKNKARAICAAEANTPQYGYLGSMYDACMRRKGWS